MRITEHLQNLISKSFPSVSNRHSGMVVFMLYSPTAQQLKDAREHLLYWSYVKAFKPSGENQMKVLVFVGNGFSKKKWDYYVRRSCKLMNQCVRQHQSLFVISGFNSKLLLVSYHHNGFLRPNDLLKPFCEFIDEMDK